MINHPLFLIDDETDEKRRSADVKYINIMHVQQGKKPVTLTNQWEPEQLQTPLDVFEAVGEVEGTYELIGRGAKHNILVRQTLNIKAPKDWKPPPKQEPSQPAAPAPASTVAATPMMQAGNLLIPANMDPMVAMVISLIAAQGQQAQAQLQRADQNSQFQTTQIATMMAQMNSNQTQLMTGMFTALAPLLGGHANASAGGSTQDGFLKGIEIMAALKEGLDAGNKAGATDWSAVAQHISSAIGSLAQVARETNNAGTPRAPHVPPGGPPPAPPAGGAPAQ